MNRGADTAPAGMPFVSIVVPTHGRPALLERLLRSLLEQEYPDDRYEIVVVHNVSDDDTESRVRALAQSSRVPVSYHAKNNRGPAPSREFGARSARGDVIAFTDDDCVATPGWVREGVTALGQVLGIVQGRTIPHPGQPRRFLEKTIDIQAATPLFETCNIFYRREAFEQAGGFSQEFLEQAVFWGEDTDLGWKVKELGFATGFAPNALMLHEVFPVRFSDWLFEPARAFQWPLLVRLHPGLRDHMFLRFFLAPRTALFDLLVLGLIGAVALHWSMSFASIPYVVYRLLEPARSRNPLVRVVRMIVGIPRAVVILAALTYGTIRFRCVLL